MIHSYTRHDSWTWQRSKRTLHTPLDDSWNVRTSNQMYIQFSLSSLSSLSLSLSLSTLVHSFSLSPSLSLLLSLSFSLSPSLSLSLCRWIEPPQRSEIPGGENGTPRAYHTVTDCNTLQHIAAHCNTLQHAATRCNTLQHTATPTENVRRTAPRALNTLQHAATTATPCNTPQFMMMCVCFTRVAHIYLSISIYTHGHMYDEIMKRALMSHN